MKKLPLKTTKHSFDYEQVYRSEGVAIYSKSEKGKLHTYEVFEIKSHNGFKVSGKYIEPSETFPHNEAFGKYAWTYPTLDRAKAKANEIESKLSKKAESKKIEVSKI